MSRVSTDMLDRIRRLFSRQPETFPWLPPITLRPIGVVRNRVKGLAAGSPREVRPLGWQDVTSRIIVRPEFVGALLGLETYSHIYVLFWPHLVPEEVRGSKHRLHPLDDPQYPLQGVLALRSQIRFNPILLSVVPLLGLKANVLRVRGLDAVDGTPVLDVKPYIPYYDAVPEARVPDWVRQRALGNT